METQGLQGGTARQKLRDELKDIATNPENKMHFAYMRGDPQVAAYLQRKYKELYPGTVEIGDGLSLEAGGSGDRRTHRKS